MMWLDVHCLSSGCHAGSVEVRISGFSPTFMEVYDKAPFVDVSLGVDFRNPITALAAAQPHLYKRLDPAMIGRTQPSFQPFVYTDGASHGKKRLPDCGRGCKPTSQPGT